MHKHAQAIASSFGLLASVFAAPVVFLLRCYFSVAWITDLLQYYVVYFASFSLPFRISRPSAGFILYVPSSVFR